MARKLGLAFALTVAVPASGWSGTSGYVQFTPTGMSVVVEQGASRKLTKIDNFVGQASTLQCVSAAGCTIVVASDFILNSQGYAFSACTLVDGAAAEPACPHSNLYNPYVEFIPQNNSSMQSALNVGPGPHTVQTQLHLEYNYPDPPTLARWQIIYTLYDH